MAVEGERQSYIYVRGIRPSRQVRLGNGIILRPVEPNPEPDDMIDSVMKNGSGSEVELGLLIATLRLTTAELVISADDARELAVRAWNSQIILVMVSAILGCEVAWYFQANDSAEEFGPDTRVSLINSYILRIPNDVREVGDDECGILERCLPRAMVLDRNRGFSIAANSLWFHTWNPRPSVRTMIVWGGIEALFGIERDISNTLARSISYFLEGDDIRFGEIKELYRLRSKSVHDMVNHKDDFETRSVGLLHELVMRSIETGRVPEVVDRGGVPVSMNK